MSNLSDKEIDRLSREAADSYEPDTSSLSWTRLEQKLAQQMPGRPPDGFRFGRIKPYVWASAIVLMGAVSFFLIKNNFYSKISTRTNSQTSQKFPAGESVQISGTNSIPPAHVASKDQHAATHSALPVLPEREMEHAATNRQNLPSDTKAGLSSSYHASKRQKTQMSEEGKAKSNLKSAIGFSISEKSAGRSKNILSAAEAPTPPVNSSSSSSGNKEANSITDKKETVSNLRKRNPLDLPSIVYPVTFSVRVIGNDSLLNAHINKSISKKSVHINRSFNIGLAFGADYTDAGGISNNQLGNNLGITVGYYLTDKISINSGISYSNKFYWSPGHGPDIRPNTSPGGGYSPTYAYAPHIEFVNGACNIYEIPLTLRYDFAKNEKTKFFVNAGLSSYLMVNQTYIYFFHSGARGLAWKSSDGQQVNYWFGVGDISFGLETNMGKGFSFQAEPYFRIPLKEMGVENVKLKSYGISLSLRYAPILSRSKK